jgi:NAD(P)-dependent dehydrogenase (short-subunit alcohol dehydrogenase family)
MSHPLQGKRALVTGGSREIGAGIVKRLAREGADVALTYVSRPDDAEETARAARAEGGLRPDGGHQPARSAFVATQAAVRHMTTRGGRVITVGS